MRITRHLNFTRPEIGFMVQLFVARAESHPDFIHSKYLPLKDDF